VLVGDFWIGTFVFHIVRLQAHAVDDVLEIKGGLFVAFNMSGSGCLLSISLLIGRASSERRRVVGLTMQAACFFVFLFFVLWSSGWVLDFRGSWP